MPNIKEKTKSQKIMWSYKPTEVDMKSVSYCLNRGIHISLLPIKNQFNKYYIEIIRFDLNMNLINRKKDSVVYDINNVIPKVYEYYRFYYERRNSKKS